MSGNRPNILFFFTDDQRFDTISALGNGLVVTPTMDELTRRGVTFTRAHIMGSYTGAVCIASRSMMLTGRSLWRSPQTIPDDAPLWPLQMGEAGYTTFMTGKWHNDRQSFARGFSGGAKIFFGGMSNHLAVPVHDFAPDGNYAPQRSYVGKKFSSELFSDEAIGFLQRHEADAPFFMYMPFTAPHDPRMAPERYDGMYDRRSVPLPTNFAPRHTVNLGYTRGRDECLAPFPRTPEIVREHLAAYYAMITHLDEQIGRVLRTLEETGHADNTIIIFAGDNGLAVGQHGLMGKQNLYDHSVRVPLIMCGPGLPAGARCDALCYLYDIYPTVCEMVGLEVPDAVEGRSLLPAVNDGAPHREDLYFGYCNAQRAVREDRYKLIDYDARGDRNTQLFDLESDPAETVNLADDPEHADTRARLRERLAEWQEQTDDPRKGDWPT